MDPATIAAAATAILAPYVKDAGAELVKTAGEIAVQKTKQLFGWLKQQFAGDPVATKDLERFEKEPAKFEPGLSTAIVEKAKADPVFANELKKQVDDIGPMLNIKVKVADAKKVTGLEGEDFRKGKANVEVDVTKGEEVTGAKLKNIG